jgi:pyridoxal phosphate enzyme (YggS family)
MSTSYSEIKKYCDERGVSLVAVSKTKTPDEILEVHSQGQNIFGENKVQELITKYNLLPKEIEWHLVGHLQTNKVKYIAPFVSLIHSIDSWKLLEEVNGQAKNFNRLMDVLLQIHIAQEETKFGLSYAEAKMILLNPELQKLSQIRIRGLMGMATLTEDEGQIRKEFRALKNFFDEMKQLQSSDLSDESESSLRYDKLQTLSIGMSSDYKIAIEEGSTMVRIGSAIFGDRNY